MKKNPDRCIKEGKYYLTLSFRNHFPHIFSMTFGKFSSHVWVWMMATWQLWNFDMDESKKKIVNKWRVITFILFPFILFFPLWWGSRKIRQHLTEEKSYLWWSGTKRQCDIVFYTDPSKKGNLFLHQIQIKYMKNVSFIPVKLMMTETLWALL